jgi:small basic protein
MKIDTQYIAELLALKGRRSNDVGIEDLIQEYILIEIKAHLDQLTGAVIERLQDIEHPEPTTKAEYDERYGIDKE